MLKVGVVAIGRNEGDRLRRCIRSIPGNVPLVYVDSASSDGSVDFALQNGREVVQLGARVRFTAALARNAGLRHLEATFPEVNCVQFIDGDCELEIGWLDLAVEFLSNNPGVGAVCGRRRERFKEASFYNQLCDDEWDTPVGLTQACGGDAMFRLGALHSVGGYDVTLAAGEEPELCARLRTTGWEIWRLDAPMTIHDAAMYRFRQWWMRAMRSGFGYAQVWHKTVGNEQPLYGRELARAAFWCAGVPAIGVLGSVLIGPFGLLLIPAIWALQGMRLSFLYGTRKGVLLLISKVAELAGAMRYLWRALTNAPGSTIFYK